MQINRSKSHSQPDSLARRYSPVVLALTTIGFATFGFPLELPAQQETGRVRDAQNGFSFVPPPGWEVSSLRPNPEVRLLYLGPTHRGFRANVNLVISTDAGESFDDVSQQMKEMYPKMLPGWKLIEQASIEIDGKKTYYMSGIYRAAGHTLWQAQFFVLGGNGKIYILTLMAANDSFDQLGPALAKSAMSIRID